MGELHLTLNGKHVCIPCDYVRSGGADTGYLEAFGVKGEVLARFRSEDVRGWWFQEKGKED